MCNGANYHRGAKGLTNTNNVAKLAYTVLRYPAAYFTAYTSENIHVTMLSNNVDDSLYVINKEPYSEIMLRSFKCIIWPHDLMKIFLAPKV